MKVVYFCLALMASTSAIAQDTRGAELATADRHLNATYRYIITRLSPADQVSLRASQRLWIQFRDADCKVWQGDNRECPAARADEREQQLRESKFFDANGEYIETPEPR